MQIEILEQTFFEFDFRSVRSEQKSVRNDNRRSTVELQAIKRQRDKQVGCLVAAQVSRKISSDTFLLVATVRRIDGDNRKFFMVAVFGDSAVK